MMKRNVMRGLQSLLCCVVLLLVCATSALAAGTELVEAAEALNISVYLNGQSAGCVTADLKELPASMEDGINLK